jgi:hypothetical protein
VAVKAGDIGNTFTDCHVAYCYYAVSGDIAAGNCSTEWVNSTLNGGVNATYSRIAFFFPRRASRIHLVNCYIEGWETCVRMGTPGNPALGGPYSCGFINTKFAATDQCIMLAAARQTTIVNCIFQGVDGTIGANNVVPLYFPSGHAAIDGTCIQPMVGYAYKGLENGDLPVDIFPGRWTYHGRVQHKAGEDGIYLHGYPNGAKIMSGGFGDPNGTIGAPRGSLYLSTSGQGYIKTTGNVGKPWNSTGWVAII